MSNPLRRSDICGMSDESVDISLSTVAVDDHSTKIYAFGNCITKVLVID